MTTPIYVFCSNYTEIVRRKVSEAVRCFGDKKVCKMRFPPPFCTGLAEGAKKFAGKRTCYVAIRLPVEFRPNRFRFAGVISAKVTWYDHSIYLGHYNEVKERSSIRT